MLRPVLLVLLGLSLAANAALVLVRRAPAEPSAPAAATPTTAAATPRAASATAAQAAPASSTAATPSTDSATSSMPRGVTWRTPRSDEDYRSLAADLHAAGVPSRLIYRVLFDLYLQRRLADSPLAKAPYWQQSGIQQSKEMRDLYRDAHQKIAALLGPDGVPSARLDAVSRKRQYGTLSDAKIDAIAAIENDYQDMQSDLYRSGPNFVMEDYATQQKQTKLLAAEKLADLAKLLTPAELAEYQLHNSQAARRAASLVSNTTVNADEYAAIVRAVEAYDAINQPMSGTINAEQAAQRRTAQANYYEQLRTAVPDARFYDILERVDSSYRTISALRTQYPSVTPAAAYAVVQLNNEMQQTMPTIFRNRPTPELIQSTYAKWNSQLDAALGTEAAAAYRKTPQGRMFNAPTMRPSTSTATPPRN